MPRKKYYKFEREEEGQCATNWWSHEIFGHNQGANDKMTELFKKKNIFSNPKPIELLCGLIRISNSKDNDIILDFFSGSATTAHAVMQLNAEDGGNRKFIMVQVQEPCEENSEAAKAGYKNICEIGKERIRRAGKKIIEELEQERESQADDLLTSNETMPLPDIGFRVLKLDSTNMEDVYQSPEEVTQLILSQVISNIKPDRTPEDLLFQVMLEFGITLDAKIEEEILAGKKVLKIADNFLIACFEDNVSEDTVKAIAKKQPIYAVLRDSSLANDNVAANFEQIFATYSPDTVRKVL